MSATIPSSLKDLRACKICSLIKVKTIQTWTKYARNCLLYLFLQTLDQFDEEGCDNCDDFLRLKNNRDRVFDCTSANFDGMMAIMDPTESWVARWQRIDNCVRGMYAISVSGELPENIKRLLREKDIPYRSRDVSHKAWNLKIKSYSFV